MTAIDCSKFSEEFSLSDEIIYLNHAAVSPWPQVTTTAVKQFADENLIHGASNYPLWMQTEASLRGLSQRLINAPSHDDIAFLKNTSEALSVVAYGIDWKKDDEIIITDQEFPSNRIVWESLEDKDVKIVVAKISGSENPEKAIIDCITGNTRLISVSSVQFATGLRINLDIIGSECRQREILFCIDAIQSLGAFSMDVQANHADFIMADGHKWLMAPEGIALLYVNNRIRNKLKLHQYGWHMVESIGDYSDQFWEPAHTARRFECGSPNMLGIHALHASLELIQSVGINKIEQCILDNTAFMIDFIRQSKNLALLYEYPVAYRSGIVTFKHKTIDNKTVFNYLTDKKVICAERGGGIRYSPHFYTPREKILTALQFAEKIAVT